MFFINVGCFCNISETALKDSRTFCYCRAVSEMLQKHFAMFLRCFNFYMKYFWNISERFRCCIGRLLFDVQRRSCGTEIPASSRACRDEREWANEYHPNVRDVTGASYKVAYVRRVALITYTVVRWSEIFVPSYNPNTNTNVARAGVAAE